MKDAPVWLLQTNTKLENKVTLGLMAALLQVVEKNLPQLIDVISKYRF